MTGVVGVAGAHETASTIAPVVDGLQPAADGVEITVQASQDATLLSLELTSDTVVEVLDEDGGAWAVIAADGVEVDLSSAAYHAATNANGLVPDPLPTDGRVRIADEPRFLWFEHRLHPSTLEVPDEVLASPVEQDVAEWVVPLRVDGVATELTGRLRHVPVLGQLVPRLVDGREVAPDVTLDVAPGPVPSFLLVNGGSVPVTVLAPDGAPYVVVGPDGAEVNIASRTWREQRRFGSQELPSAADGPVFQRMSATASHSWLDARASLPGLVPGPDVRSSDEEVVVLAWSIPLQVGDELVDVAGETVWQPLGSTDQRSGSARGGGVAWEWVVAALAAVVLAGVALRRRTR